MLCEADCHDCDYHWSKKDHVYQQNNDEKSHYQQCKHCFDIKEDTKDVHKFKTIVNGNMHIQKCIDCEYKTGEHEVVIEYSYNRINHWKICSVENCDFKEHDETHEIVTK